MAKYNFNFKKIPINDIFYSSILILLLLPIPAAAEIQGIERFVRSIQHCWVTPTDRNFEKIQIAINVKDGNFSSSDISISGENTANNENILENFRSAKTAILRCADYSILSGYTGQLILNFSKNETSIHNTELVPVDMVSHDGSYLMDPLMYGHEIQLNLYLTPQSIAEPRFTDNIDKDPFNRGVEYDIYKSTSVSCVLNLFMRNDSEYDIAFKDPFSSVIGLRFIKADGENYMQGNVGLSTMLSGMPGGDRQILQSAGTVPIQFVSLTSNIFSSREEARQWVNQGGCDFQLASSVERYGIVGEVMIETNVNWVPLEYVLGVMSILHL